MRPKLRKDLLRRFPHELERRLPRFKPDEEESDSEFPVWKWQLAPELALFVMLQYFPRDQFVIEIAWSEDGAFPWETLPSHPPKIEAPRFRERLSQLWATGKVADPWAIVPDDPDEIWQSKKNSKPPEEDVLPKVASLVEDSIQKLIEFGMPVFQKVAKNRALPWPE